MMRLLRIPEPRLLFQHGQTMEDPRDGLTLFGPLDREKVYGIRAAVIGTADGIGRFQRWCTSIQRPVAPGANPNARPHFPGFEAAFRVPWNPQPVLTRTIDAKELDRRLHIADKYQRVYETVELFSAAILEAAKSEEFAPDLWIVVVPDDVYRYCRPQSIVEANLRVQPQTRLTKREADRLLVEPSLFASMNQAAESYRYDAHFHNQLKARLLERRITTQIVRESTIAPRDFLNARGEPKRNLDAVVSDIAWTLSSSVFYKAGGRPWKLDGVREGVCYVGMVFKRDDRNANEHFSCCAAQMFLDSGDGVVFRGAVGPWYSPTTRDFHLDRTAARELVAMALASYRELTGGPPRELFIHGRIRFSDEEWAGFTEGAGADTNVVGVRIRQASELKLFRTGKMPPLRGVAYVESPTLGYLWTKGYIPRLRTYPGREVPNPILVEVSRGAGDIETVLSDVLALTKLNYNSCVFGDGDPVTLIFADAIGEILTAGPVEGIPPLPFKYYI
ncbi:MAG: hypothetical protein QOK37_272 [Thermoanaerobaculia bacterium]|jgi:hypothetical protein|nr:hypothetical protein [Thermoanaerobaculia bacterium]